MTSKRFGELIYTPGHVAGEAASKAETHTPKIEAPETAKAGEPITVRISVGPHPNTREHSIRWIEVYVYEEGRAFNPIYVAHIDLEPGVAEPDVTLRIRLSKSGVIYALAYCNLHGVWEARKEIKVE